MKKVLLFVILMITIIFANGCVSKKTSIKDFWEFPSESPKSIEVLYDDPNKESSFITNDDDIDMILNTLFARVYKEVKTVTPKSNMRIRLIYDSENEIIISLNGITDSSNKKYEPVSEDGLESLILTVLKENN